MTARSKLTAALLVFALSAGACGGNDDSSPPSTAATSTTSPSSTTTSPASTTTEPTSTTSTTVATTIAIDEIDATKEEIATAAVRSREDYLYAVQNYDAPDALVVLGRTAAANSPAFQQGVDNMENLRSNGWRVKPNPEVASSLIVESEATLLDGPPATRAEITVCEIGAGIVYEPGTGPDGADTIVNDEINARRSRVTMVFEDGAWKVHSGHELGVWNGQPSCPAA